MRETGQSPWYKDAVFYEVYVRAFADNNGDGHGDLPGLTQKLDYLQDLGVDVIWLMPFYPSPLKDDGYDISDYYGILPEYGTLDDFREFIDAAHQRGMRVITDLVLNHTSDQHAWFQAARADPTSPYREYYVWSDTDRKYQAARIIFTDTEDSNWTWDEQAGQYFWHRFYSSQPDLNYDNPAVQDEMIKIMRFWLDMGIDGFRADAVPYLYEREATDCENLPQTHAYLKRIRRFMDGNYPGRILLAEANQWPEDVRPYFGDEDEFHMGFHFPIMPRLYMALRQSNTKPLVDILARTPPIPQTNQWCIFLRNHDELTLEMVTQAEREWMWQEYAPDPRMRLNLGIRRRLATLLDNDARKIALMNSLLFTLAGSPIIYYGDEIGMGDNIWLSDRNGVRTPMQWNDQMNAGFSTADESKLYAPVVGDAVNGYTKVNVADQQSDSGSLFWLIRRMIAVRKQHRVIGRGDFTWVSCGTEQVAAYLRSSPAEQLLIVNNLSASTQAINCLVPQWQDGVLHDLLTDAQFPVDEGGLALTLAPYQYLWLAR